MVRFLTVCVSFAILIWFIICNPTARGPIVFQDDFEQGGLDSSRWEVTMDGDFAEAVVGVVDLNGSETSDYWLRLRTNTIGTSDLLKYLGVTSKDEVELSTASVVEFALDWNNQMNGCYLTASLYLCPTKSSNPKNEANWLKFEYVGVPPGRNVRTNVWEKVDGVVNQLHTDWGPSDEDGRPIGKPLGLDPHRIEMFVGDGSLRVLQDTEEILRLSKHDLNFTKAYIYLQVSSGTNYPTREVYFDNILVQRMSSP